MKTDRDIFLTVSLMILCAGNAFGQAAPAASIKASRAVKAPEASVRSSAPAKAPVPGERKFQANCSRCHDAPEQLSPRITGTVLRHMRVRASLSAEDEREILRYLAP
jgi:cytochrome c5